MEVQLIELGLCHADQVSLDSYISNTVSRHVIADVVSKHYMSCVECWCAASDTFILHLSCPSCMASPEQLGQWHPSPLPLLHPLQLLQHRRPCRVTHQRSVMIYNVAQVNKVCGQVLVGVCKLLLSLDYSEHLHATEHGDPNTAQNVGSVKLGLKPACQNSSAACMQESTTLTGSRRK